jgi:predicted enzyme related to lactoylglutathione lyase
VTRDAAAGIRRWPRATSLPSRALDRRANEIRGPSSVEALAMQNPVGWFEIYVQDMPRAKAFYEGVLAAKLEKLEAPDSSPFEMWAFPMQQDGTGAAGALVKMEGMPSGGNSTLVYFSCQDCAVEAGRVAGQGGKVIKDKFSIGPYGFIALVTDTEGNMIGLHSTQ